MEKTALDISTLKFYFDKLDELFPEMRLEISEILKDEKLHKNLIYTPKFNISDMRIELNQMDENEEIIKTTYNGIENKMIKKASTGCVGKESKTKNYVKRTYEHILKSIVVEMKYNNEFKEYIKHYYTKKRTCNYKKLNIGNPLRYIKKNENIFTTIHDMYINVYIPNCDANEAHKFFYARNSNCKKESKQRFWSYWKCYFELLT